MPARPGTTPMMPPDTPDFAGTPTSEIQSPAESYMPHAIITLSTWRATRGAKTRSPVSG